MLIAQFNHLPAVPAGNLRPHRIHPRRLQPPSVRLIVHHAGHCSLLALRTLLPRSPSARANLLCRSEARRFSSSIELAPPPARCRPPATSRGTVHHRPRAEIQPQMTRCSSRPRHLKHSLARITFMAGGALCYELDDTVAVAEHSARACQTLASIILSKAACNLGAVQIGGCIHDVDRLRSNSSLSSFLSPARPPRMSLVARGNDRQVDEDGTVGSRDEHSVPIPP
ncbi:hypothetical protein BJV74DRAFT_857133 [Russula compacta]|nr:hypothetical protein BJV74DRAFT_857133 [Russula compacta]